MHGAGRLLLPAPGGAGRLAVDGGDLVPGRVQRPQRRHGEVRAAHEGEAQRRAAHRVSRASFDFSSLASLRSSMLRFSAREVVHEQHAVQVVDLVLQAGREQPVGLDLAPRAGQVLVAHPHPRRARHVGDTGRAGTGSLPRASRARGWRRRSRGSPAPSGRGLRPSGQVHHDQAQQLADLRRGQPDAGRRVHRRQHLAAPARARGRHRPAPTGFALARSRGSGT